MLKKVYFYPPHTLYKFGINPGASPGHSFPPKRNAKAENSAAICRE